MQCVCVCLPISLYFGPHSFFSLSSLNSLPSVHPTDWTTDYYLKPYRPGSLPLHSGRSRIHLHVGDRAREVQRMASDLLGSLFSLLCRDHGPFGWLAVSLLLLSCAFSLHVPRMLLGSFIHRTVPHDSDVTSSLKPFPPLLVPSSCSPEG